MVQSQLQPAYDPTFVGFSLLIAVFASYVALDLARRVRTTDRLAGVLWTAGGALVLGSGIWSMHFAGMVALSLPIAIGYQGGATLVSWIAAVVTSAIALRVAARDQLTLRVLAIGALAMGGGICAMHYLGMSALVMSPAIRWDTALVGASIGIAVLASAIALMMFFGMRELSGRQAQGAQALAAVIMGAAIGGMHYTGMAAAGFDAAAVCLSADGLAGASLADVVIAATLVLLSITLCTSVLDARGQARAARISGSLRTATEQLGSAHAELRRRELLDTLTGVASRALLEAQITRAADEVDAGHPGPGRRSPRRLAVLFIDLDGFHAVVDRWGETVSDGVLRQTAARLTGLAGVGHTVARLEADRFVLLMDDVVGSTDAIAMAERVLHAATLPHALPNRQLALTCSIGIVVYPEGSRRDRLIADADVAMWQAKRCGGNDWRQFEPGMQREVADRLDLLQDLRVALARRDLELHYQPKLDARSGAVIGAEALLRWTHPTRGAIAPADFIPVAERFGMIVAIGQWVIEEACGQMSRWSAHGYEPRIAVNLSPYQLRQPDFVDWLGATLARHGVRPSQLTCEITETVAMENARAAAPVLARLAALGVQLSIDDFGTGYSSLAALRSLRVHELKIDRSFVGDLASDGDARAVVDAVVRLGHALGLRIVAEGVETAAQREVLASLGCDELQGFLFAEPMTARALEGGGLLPVTPSMRTEAQRWLPLPLTA